MITNTGYYASCQGDSGGSWFQITGTTTAKFAGINAASDSQINTKTRPDGQIVKCFSNGYFSPVAQIRIAYPGRVFTFIR